MLQPTEHDNQVEKTALDRGRTDRMSLTHDLDPDLQLPASYKHTDTHTDQQMVGGNGL